jgi:hypothetical protein
MNAASSRSGIASQPIVELRLTALLHPDFGPRCVLAPAVRNGTEPRQPGIRSGNGAERSEASGSGSLATFRSSLSHGAWAPEADHLGDSGALRGIGGRRHRVIIRQAVAVPIAIRRAGPANGATANVADGLGHPALPCSDLNKLTVP